MRRGLSCTQHSLHRSELIGGGIPISGSTCHSPEALYTAPAKLLPRYSLHKVGWFVSPFTFQPVPLGIMCLPHTSCDAHFTNIASPAKSSQACDQPAYRHDCSRFRSPRPRALSTCPQGANTYTVRWLMFIPKPLTNNLTTTSSASYIFITGYCTNASSVARSHTERR